jgi:hypothetical protein
MTLSIMVVTIMTLGLTLKVRHCIMTIITMTLSIMTLSIMTLGPTNTKSATLHNANYHNSFELNGIEHFTLGITLKLLHRTMPIITAALSIMTISITI